MLPTSSLLVPPHFCQALHYTLASKTCLQPVGWGSTVSRLLWSIANAERLSRKQAEHRQWSISQGTKRESFKEWRTYGSWLIRDSLLQRLRAKVWHKITLAAFDSTKARPKCPTWTKARPIIATWDLTVRLDLLKLLLSHLKCIQSITVTGS